MRRTFCVELNHDIMICLILNITIVLRFSYICLKNKKNNYLTMILIFFERKKQHLKEHNMDFTMFHRGSTSGSLRQCLGKSARDQFFHSGRAAVQRRRFKHRKWDMFHHENGWKWMKQLEIWWWHIFWYAIFFHGNMI